MALAIHFLLGVWACVVLSAGNNVPEWAESLVASMQQLRVEQREQRTELGKLREEQREDLGKLREEQKSMRDELRSELRDLRYFAHRRVEALRSCTHSIRDRGRYGVVTKGRVGNSTFLVTAQHNLPMISESSSLGELPWCCQGLSGIAIAIASADYLQKILPTASSCDFSKTQFLVGEPVVSFSPSPEHARATCGQGLLTGELKQPIVLPASFNLSVVAEVGYPIVNIPLFGGYSGSAISNGKILGAVVGEVPCVNDLGDTRQCGIVAPAAAIAEFVNHIRRKRSRSCGLWGNNHFTGRFSCGVWRDDNVGEQLRRRTTS